MVVITKPKDLGDQAACAFEFFPFPAAKVWDVLKDWSGSYISASETPVSVTSSDEPKVGACRMLTNGEMPFKEELTMLDEENMQFSYKFAGPSPFPVDKYGGLVIVDPISEQSCKAIWVGYCDVDVDPHSILVENAPRKRLVIEDLALDGLYQAFLNAAMKILKGE